MSKTRSVQVLLLEGDRPARILAERELPPAGQIGVALQSEGDVTQVFHGKEFDVMQVDSPTKSRDSGQPVQVLRGSGGGTELIVVSEPGEDETLQRPDLIGEAYDFLTRPLDPDEIQQMLQEAGETTVKARPAGLRASGVLGSSPAIIALLDRVTRIARSSASILIQGETGTGKTLIARTIHENSERRDKPFVVVNCSAFQDQLLESELFGHEKGAFTGAVTAKKGLFEIAHGGTLFLDEVGEMSAAMQAKLLQVLDSGEMRRVGGTSLRKVDARIVAATNRDLEARVKEEEFREDLLFRLRVVALTVPPLRERKADIPELVEHFLARFKPLKGISPAALRLLMEYRWPGNVRELANSLEGLVLLSAGDVIEPSDLPPSIRPPRDFELEDAETPLPMTEIERLHITRVLRYTEGKKAPAARILKIDVKTLNSKIRNYDIEV